MSDNVNVYNPLVGDYQVRSTETTDKKQIQHVRIDLGVGSGESVVSGTVPVSVTGDVSVAFPTTQDVNVTNASIPVTIDAPVEVGGTVAVSSMPAIEIPATEGAATEAAQVAQLEIEQLKLMFESGETATLDTNLATVFGAAPLVDLSGRLKTVERADSARLNTTLIGTNAERRIACDGWGTCAVQLSGTWAGTQTFEVTVNGSDWVGVTGYNVATHAPIITTTAGGVFVFPVVGCAAFRVRFSTYTSGTALLSFLLTPTVAPEGILKDTSFRATTYDANVATVLGTATLVRPINDSNVIVAPTAPTVQATPAAPMYARAPQIYARARVEAGGSEKLPFAQEPITNRMMVTLPQEYYRILEDILLQLVLLNNVERGTKDDCRPQQMVGLNIN